MKNKPSKKIKKKKIQQQKIEEIKNKNKLNLK